ncbi:MAG: hypothetical protein GY723_01015 [bacterium]|nr:hypothetical protein [bacterium]MCP5068738.1 hypothetical protein [bacterium]
MPITRTIVRECNLVVTMVAGEITFEQIQDSRILLDTLSGFSSTLDSLIILGPDADFSKLTSEELAAFSTGKTRFSVGSKGVIVAYGKLAYGMARLFSSHRTTPGDGHQIRIAKTLEEALDLMDITIDQLPESVIGELPETT